MSTQAAWPDSQTHTGLGKQISRGLQQKPVWIAIAGLLTIVLLVGIAIVSNGYDVRETKPTEIGVWVTRTSASGAQYAKLNTVTGELETVKSVREPSGIAQFDHAGAILTRGNAKAWALDSAMPQDITDADKTAPTNNAQPAESDGGGSTPSGTESVITAGKWTLMRTSQGGAFIAEIDKGQNPATQLAKASKIGLGKSDEKQKEGADDNYKVTEASIANNGVAVLYTRATNEIHKYDAVSHKIKDSVKVATDIAQITDLQIALVHDKWVLFDSEKGRLWLEGTQTPIQLESNKSARLQSSASQGKDILIADDKGLLRINDGKSERVIQASGSPAQPQQIGDKMMAAWAGANNGTLWRSDKPKELTQLEYDKSVSGANNLSLEFRDNGNVAVLNDSKTGMLWQLPDGKAIPVKQWEQFDPPKKQDGTVVTADPQEPKPPVAGDDKFGFRAGLPTILPVMLNDYDPNKSDVLSIDPESITGLDPNFGKVTLLPDGQTLVFNPAAGAGETATFKYKLSDGALKSNDATVTLTKAAATIETAPAWCPVDGCQRSWNGTSLIPSGTSTIPVLDGWVDPEGDQLTIVGAQPATADTPLIAMVTEDNRLAIHHTNPSAGEGDYSLKLTVADNKGKTTTRDLPVHVRGGAKPELTNMATQMQAGSSTAVDLTSQISGGSGLYGITTVSSTNDAIQATAPGNGRKVFLTSSKPGDYPVRVTVQDKTTNAEVSGIIRVTVTAQTPRLALPPMRAYVRPYSDTTIDVLSAIPGNFSRDISVQDVVAQPDGDSQLRADLVQHHKIRIAGDSARGGGYIGAVKVNLAGDNGDLTTVVHVFQLPDVSAQSVISVPDVATVRAGSIVDIPVLDNDVAPRGERLFLSPQVTGSGQQGELVFASGTLLRYRAPQNPGTYTVRYTAVSATAPDARDSASVRVTVIPNEGNRAPSPVALVGRVSPGESTELEVPLTGIDPDGDRAIIRDIDMQSGELNAQISDAGNSIVIKASPTAKPGVKNFNYRVEDERGERASAQLRVVVTAPSAKTLAPIVYTDYLRLVAGSGQPQEVQPLNNDIDPSGGKLRITEIVPNLPNGVNNPRFEQLKSQINIEKLSDGLVSVTASKNPETVSYRYTAESDKTKSKTDGLLVVQSSKRVGVLAPSVQDTILTVSDKARIHDQGIDVVAGKVSWMSGNINDLQLSLVDKTRGQYRVEGHKIIGDYQADGDIVPFKLEGAAITGEKISSYGFMIVRPLKKLTLALAPGFQGLTVDEDATTEKSLSEVFGLQQNEQLEFANRNLGVSRPEANCSISGDRIVYKAGKGQPWQDNCVVDVKLQGQPDFTRLLVPVTITPKEPIAVAQTMSRTVQPATQQSISLQEMVRWEGYKQGNPAILTYSLSQESLPAMHVSLAGGTVNVNADANVKSGAELTLTVTVHGAGPDTSAALVLRVSDAPIDKPKGGTLSLICKVGETCGGALVGAAGEYDPFAGKSGGGLKVTEVVNGTCAPLGQLTLAGDRVNMVWRADNTAGQKCTATFTVNDAQGRTGQGTIELDAQGLPAAPVSIDQVEVTADSAVVVVTPSSQVSYPDITGMKLYDGANAVGSCEKSGASYRCVVTGLKAGEKHTVTAKAVNSVGESTASAPKEIWAYEAPGKATVEAVQDGLNTATLKIRGSGNIKSYKISVDNGPETVVEGQNPDKQLTDLSEGSHSITVTPIAVYSPPVGVGSSTATTASVDIKGKPKSVTLTLNANESEIIANVGAVSDTGEIQYGIKVGGVCELHADSSFRVSFAKEMFKQYDVQACATNKWGETVGETKKAYMSKKIPTPNTPTLTLGNEWISEGGHKYIPIRGAEGMPNDNGDGQIKTDFDRNNYQNVILPKREWTITRCKQIDGADDVICSDPAIFSLAQQPPIVNTALIDAIKDHCISVADETNLTETMRKYVVAGDYVSTTRVDSNTITMIFSSVPPLRLSVSKCAAPAPTPAPTPPPAPAPTPGHP